MVGLVLLALGAALLSFFATPLTMRLARTIGAVDSPGPRKLHSTSMPRLGGVAVLVSLVLTATAAAAWMPDVRQFLGTIAAGATLGLLPIALVSLLDDVKPMRALPKAGAHLLGAALAVAMGVRLDSSIHLLGYEISIGWWAIPVSVLWLVGLTNAFNLVDGLDGLSAGLALISAATLTVVALAVGRLELAAVALMLVGALSGFLPYNLYPARTFLGDTGSTGIGFLLGCLALKGGSTLSSGMAVLVPVIVLGVPIAETLVSMTRRALARLRRSSTGGIFEADGKHFHHRLLQLGVTHRRAVLLLHGVGVVLGVLAVASLFLSQGYVVILLVGILLAAAVGLSRLGYEEFDVIGQGDLLRLYDLPVLRNAFFLPLVDIFIAATTLYVAWGIKFEQWTFGLNDDARGRLLAFGPLLLLASFLTLGLYRRSWRIATVADLAAVGLGSTMAAALTLGVERLWIGELPVTFFVVYLLLLGGGLMAVRGSYRLFHDSMRRSRRRREGEPVLIYAAGVGGAMALREILQNEDVDFRPVGFLDDDPRKEGRSLSGFSVLGSLGDLEQLLRERDVRGVILASSKITPEQRAECAAICEAAGVWTKRFRVGFEEGSGEIPTSELRLERSPQRVPRIAAGMH